MARNILVTGGAGFIGSHTCVELLAAGHEITVIDNLENSCQESLARVRRLAGRDLRFVKGDIRDRAALDGLFGDTEFEAVVHFAGLKAVGESTEIPLAYYRNNVTGTITLLEAMAAHGCRRIVFSSSATVYGDPASVPITEDFPLQATNPYGRTKLFIEEILRDVCRADDSWRCLLLRYFNPIGAHPSGQIGEDPAGIPNNLLPYVMQVAAGVLDQVRVFGDDYPTPDGTGIRDYIHITDLAQGHVAALEKLDKLPGCRAVNLGTGRGYSVLEVLAAARRATGQEIPAQVVARRPGDVAACYADPGLAADLLGWRAQFNLERMCEDAWRWQSENPHGYRAKS